MTPAGASKSPYSHGTAIVVGERGVLILGESGAGKSALAERMIVEARGRGTFSCLVGDDRIAVLPAGGRLVVSGHPAIRGQIERRGIGLHSVDFVEKAVLSGVIFIDRDPPRLPAPNGRTYGLQGVELPLLTLRNDLDLAAKAHLALEWIRA